MLERRQNLVPAPPRSGPGMPMVYIVEDDGEVRAALQYLLKSDGLRVEAYPSAEGFLEAFDPHDAGCVLLDLRLPGIGGLELLRTMRRKGVMTPVIMLTAFGDVPTAVAAIEAGAYGFLEKPFEPATLLHRVRQALQSSLQDRRAQQERARAEALCARLTPRQRQVMSLMAAGHPTKEIAARLGVSYRTAETHRLQVMKGMKVKSLAELATLVVRFGLGGDEATERRSDEGKLL
jgi:FixJ family two-component response regulator